MTAPVEYEFLFFSDRSVCISIKTEKLSFSDMQVQATFWGAKDFCLNFPKLARKVLFSATPCANISSHTHHEHLLLG